MHALARATPSGRLPAQAPPPPPPPSPVASAAAWELAIATPPFSAAALLCALATPLPVARALELAVASPPLAAVACALALATASSLRAAQRGEGGRRGEAGRQSANSSSWGQLPARTGRCVPARPSVAPGHPPAPLSPSPHSPWIAEGSAEATASSSSMPRALTVVERRGAMVKGGGSGRVLGGGLVVGRGVWRPRELERVKRGAERGGGRRLKGELGDARAQLPPPAAGRARGACACPHPLRLSLRPPRRPGGA